MQGTIVASAIEGALREAGIPAMIRGSGHGAWLFAGAGGGLGSVDVMVPSERLEEARDVLRTFDKETDG